jgi:hypothetical protein
MDKSKSVPTPASDKQDFGPRREDEGPADTAVYQSLIGCIGYIGEAARGDLVLSAFEIYVALQSTDSKACT